MSLTLLSCYDMHFLKEKGIWAFLYAPEVYKHWSFHVFTLLHPVVFSLCLREACSRFLECLEEMKIADIVEVLRSDIIKYLNFSLTQLHLKVLWGNILP